MNRSVGILLVVVAVFTLVCVALVFALERQSFNNAQTALTKYLVYRNSGATSALLTKQFVHAAVPSAFTREMSGASFGESNVFQTTQDYRVNVVFDLPDSPTAPPVPASYYRGSRPLPFPPTDVWCVLIKADDAPTEIGFVALHQDLYNADWLVHIPPGDQSVAELNKNLSTIGCQFNIDQ